MDSTDRRAEVEQLDTQRARLEELLANERFSTDLSKSLKRLVDDIAHRIIKLKAPEHHTTQHMGR